MPNIEPLDLKKFVWMSKEDKNPYLILAITTYGGDDVVVYRQATSTADMCVTSVGDFCERFEATYDLTRN